MQPIRPPLTIFLLGATGDLAKKKILPAIFQLFKKGVLSNNFQLIGMARRPMTHLQFQNYVNKIVSPIVKDADWPKFSQNLFYVSGDLTNAESFKKLKHCHQQLQVCGNHLWYVATLPKLYLDVIRNIKELSLEKTACGWTKFLLEKPFGTDLASSQLLNRELLQVFAEDQIYRIDHFLAKETIQNLMVFRFGNGIFEHLWNRHHVDNIQITVAEQMGINERADFYDSIGVVRDVVQNHLLQMLTMTLMEEPADLQPKTIHTHRMQFLSQLEVLDPITNPGKVVFGQYDQGTLDGKLVKAYRQEAVELSNSLTPTAIAAKLCADSERWQGTPIYLRAGKRLAQSVAEITLQFKEPINEMFKKHGIVQRGNLLTLRIQPNEGVVLRMNVKKPGLDLNMSQVPMQFCYKSEFQMGLVEAYQKLIYDAAQGDPTLFPQALDIEASWRVIQPTLDYLQDGDHQPDLYQAGSWGPPAFAKLLARDNRHWSEPSPGICNF